jgi:hypothetical protein
MKLLGLLFSVTAMFAVPSIPSAAAAAADVHPDADQISVQTTGNVTFDLDSDDVFDLHGNGTLRVTENDGTTTHFLSARGTQVIYKVNGAARPFDDDAKDWLRGVLAQEPPPPPPPPT